jgi:hypothetical protein
MPKEEFRREVDRYLTGKETEPWELLYFKVYKSQLSVIERALETATLMLGNDKWRGYCLEMPLCYRPMGDGSGCISRPCRKTV